MSTVPVGSSWRSTNHPSVTAKVVHMLDHLRNGQMTRHIVYEQFWSSQTTTIPDGLHIKTKTEFERDFERPEIIKGDEVP